MVGDPELLSGSLDQRLDALRGAPAAGRAVLAAIGGLRLAARSDDAAFLPGFLDLFGGDVVDGHAPLPPVDLGIEIHVPAAGEYGRFRLHGASGLPVDAREFSFSLQHEGGLFERIDAAEPGWICLAFRGTCVPAIAFRGNEGLFALASRWRETLQWFLFWRALRLRRDAIFFHASSLGIDGQGTMFVGPAGAGKSTTSLALAARGHNFLGDEIAAYLPATRELIPFRRPVGIKPGPRASAVQRGLAEHDARRIEHEGFARVDIDRLMTVDAAQPVPLERVVFLRGFRPEPALRRVEPTRDDVAALQPLLSSFLDRPHARGVFEIARLLSGARVYQLHPGAPDATAEYLEEAFASE